MLQYLIGQHNVPTNWSGKERIWDLIVNICDRLLEYVSCLDFRSGLWLGHCYTEDTFIKIIWFFVFYDIQ